MYSTGSNNAGQLGHGTDVDSAHFLPVQFPSNHGGSIRPRQLAFGGSHTLLLTTDGKLLVAGNNEKGQLGPTREDDGDGAEGTHRLAFGEVTYHELLSQLPGGAAQREALAEHAWEIASVAAAWETSFVLLRPKPSVDGQRAGDDALLVFGANDWEEHANGDEMQSTAPAAGHRWAGQISFRHLLEKEDEVVRLLSIKAGPRHSVALIEMEGHRSNSTARRLLVGWGAARHGQLGVVAEGQKKPPRTIKAPQIITLPPQLERDISPPMQVVDFDVGRDHTVVLLRRRRNGASPTGEQDTIVMLGNSRLGQLGPSPLAPNYNIMTVDSDSERVLQVLATWSGSYWLTVSTAKRNERHRLYGAGANSHSQLARPASAPSPSTGIPLPFDRVDRIACGSEHVVVVVASTSVDYERPQVWAWGWNEHGNLGTGTQVDVEAPTRVAEDVAGQVCEVWAGNATSWIWTDDSGDGAPNEASQPR